MKAQGWNMHVDNDRDKAVANAQALDVRDGEVFVAAVVDRDGATRLALTSHTPSGGTAVAAAMLDERDYRLVMIAMACAARAHGWSTPVGLLAGLDR
jgi:hypothetical protein